MNRHTLIIINLILIFTLNLTACTSTPFIRYKSPNIGGTIYSNAEPAAKINLFLSIVGSDKHCAQFIAKSTTDDSGNFSFSSIKERLSYTPLMTHYLDEWTVCAEISETRQLIYANNRYDRGGAIAAVNLQCDLKNIGRQDSICKPSPLKD